MTEPRDGRECRVYLSIVVPMYNEEGNVAHTVEQINGALQGQVESYEIVLVNDGSTDRTLEAAKRLMAAHERVRVIFYVRNGRRGKALRTGLAQAGGRIVASIDADLSYSSEIVLEFVRTLQDDPELDMVLASPYMEGGSVQGASPMRLLVSRLGNLVLSAAIAGHIRTSTCIVRGYRREVLESLQLGSDGKEIHLEILAKALALGYRAKDIPAVLRNRKRGRSKFRSRITALSHLVFTFFETPMLLFGLVGLMFVLLGLAGGGYIIVLWQQRALNPERPLMTLTVLLIVTGMQALSFGFIGTQLVLLRKEIYKVQMQNRQATQKLADPGMVN